MRRRTFLSVGLAGAAALAAAAWWTGLRPLRAKPALDDDAKAIVAAIVPAMLDGMLPATGRERRTAIDETVAGVDRAIMGLPPAARAELGQLFALLNLPLTRRAFAGVSPGWAEASVTEVSAFLDRWRASAWALKRSAYDALHQLVFAAWYGNVRAWPAIGYPGPPKIG